MDYTNLDKVIAGLRREYSFGALEDDEAHRDPFHQFVNWFEQALEARVSCINFLYLATASKKAQPSVRTLLLKGFSPSGFVFYTHYGSKKAYEVEKNPRAEGMLYWPEVERQVRITGKLVKIPRKDSLCYFLQRPRAAQLGAWVSHQSQPIDGRGLLDKKYAQVVEKFKGKEVPLPPFWGGYRLVPEAYEFWQGRASRLNDRFLYTKSRVGWKRVRLQP